MKRTIALASGMLFALPLFASPGPGDYVQDGLVALYDGVYNAKDANGALVYDANASTWANIAKGCGDAALPADKYTVGVDSISLDNAQAIASDATFARASVLTLEACARSTAAPPTSQYDKPFVTVTARAMAGYDARNGYGLTCTAVASSNWGTGKMKYYRGGGWNFDQFGTTLQSISYVAKINNAGIAFTNGVQLASMTGFYDGAVQPPPDGTVKLGNSSLSMVMNCVRIYNRELSADEVKLNAAIDAVRFRGKSTSEVVLPAGYSWDANGDLIPTGGEGQHRIKLDGSVTFEAPYDEHRMLVNATGLGPVVFDESEQIVDDQHKIVFDGFDAPLGGATTVFNGGYWDFNKQSDGHVNFFTNTATVSSRTTIITNHATVTGIGGARIAGSSGTDNRLVLAGGSSMEAASMSLGSLQGTQRTTVRVEGGSELAVSGNLYLTTSGAQTENGAKQLSGNGLVVTGADSTLSVGGMLSLGATADGADQWGYIGGTYLEITDGATANIEYVKVGSYARTGHRNRMTFGKDSIVNITNLKINPATPGDAYPVASNVVEILDGAVVTVSDTFTLGSTSTGKSNGGNQIVVSNAVFHMNKGHKFNDSYYLMNSRDSEFRLSGPNAQFIHDTGLTAINYTGMSGNSFIVENGCTHAFRNSALGYINDINHCSLVVRDHATVTRDGNLHTTTIDNRDLAASSGWNRFILQKDSELNISESFSANWNFDGVEVDDSFFRVGYGGDFGRSDGKATNTYLRVSGTHPSVYVGRNLNFYTNAEFRVSLPAAGYDGGYATYEKPLVDSAHLSSQYVRFHPSSSVVFEGVEDFLKYHVDHDLKGSYYLVKAYHLMMSDEQLAAAKAALSSDGKVIVKLVLKRETDSAGSAYLRLDVKPRYGTVIFVR